MTATHARIYKDIAKGATADTPELTLNAEHKDLRKITSDKHDFTHPAIFSNSVRNRLSAP